MGTNFYRRYLEAVDSYFTDIPTGFKHDFRKEIYGNNIIVLGEDADPDALYVA
jgi:hypothetical protein